MEEIPGSSTKSQELVLFLPLGLGRISARSKGPRKRRVGASVCRRVGSVVGIRTVPKRWASIVMLIFTPGATTGGRIQRQHRSRRRRNRKPTRQRRRLGGHVESLWGGRGGRLVASIMYNSRQKFISPTRQFLHSFLSRSVLARPAGGLRHAGQTG